MHVDGAKADGSGLTRSARNPAGHAVLVTGGAGFFGEILKNRLLAEGADCVSIDLQPDTTTHPRLTSVRGDIRDQSRMDQLFQTYRFSTVYHCAAILAHAVADTDLLWTSNVDGTRVVADLARQHGARKVVFISSNCLWAAPFGRPVVEADQPQPREIYGRSKWEGEKILAGYANAFEAVILRCPTIIASGRLGLLSILFEFIHEGRRVWVVGGGANRYQFIYAQDLADVCLRAAAPGVAGVFNIGSDRVAPLRDVYQQVIDRAGTAARVASLPKTPALAMMRLAHAVGLSPLGPYQYRMIAEDFEFDTTKLKTQLAWAPTLTNGEMLAQAYEYYRDHLDDIRSRTDVSAHRQPARLGAIRLLKWLS